MTPRLPVPGSDSNVWGDEINEFLRVHANEDGTLKVSALASPNGVAPAGANYILISLDAVRAVWQQAVIRATATPNQDSALGSPGNSGQYADGAHSHPLSGLYDKHGVTEISTVAVSGATQIIPEPASYQVSNIKLTAACTLVFPAAGAGKWFELHLRQDATGGRTVQWPANINWPGGVAPTLSSVAGLKDVLIFRCVDGNNWDGRLVATGIVTAPLPLAIIQQVSFALTNGSITFPADITPGNSILLVGNFLYSDRPQNLSGGGVTWKQIGALGAPAVPTVVPQGATGATTYKYQITYVNAFGETVASTVATITNGNAVLSGTNKNRVSWPAAPTDATSVRVYGRSGSTLGLIATVAVGTTQFDDDGTVTPGAVPPANDTTGDLPVVVDDSTSVHPQAFLGTGSSGGPGTATVNFNRFFSGVAYEIQAAALDTTTPPKTSSATVSAFGTYTSPARVADAAGLMPFVLVGAHQGLGSNPGAPWSVAFFHNEARLAYQTNTVSGNSYSASWPSANTTDPIVFSSLSFFLKPA